MTVWRYIADVRMTPAAFRAMFASKECPLCKGRMARVAERGLDDPYPWVPIGYICTKCNTIFAGAL